MAKTKEQDEKVTSLKSELKKDSLVTSSIPPQIATRGPGAVKAYKASLLTQRENLYNVMEGVKGVRLNTPKRVLFDITTEINSGEVLFSLSSSKRTAAFGKNGVIDLKDIPLHGLLAIYAGLENKDLFDITDGDVSVNNPLTKRPKLTAENDDPMRDMHEKKRKELSTILNSSDPGNTNAPANGNTLKNIMERAEAMDDLKLIKSMIIIEKENRNRLEIIDSLETLLYSRQNSSQESKVLASIAN